MPGASEKISQLGVSSPGGPLQQGDVIPIDRGGANYGANPQVVTAKVALVVGQQSYAINFGGVFAAAPSAVWFEIEMPNSSGELFSHGFDGSSLTAAGVTAWLSGIPTAASTGGYLIWHAVP
jgi:hypothetical protein